MTSTNTTTTQYTTTPNTATGAKNSFLTKKQNVADRIVKTRFSSAETRF